MTGFTAAPAAIVLRFDPEFPARLRHGCRALRHGEIAMQVYGQPTGPRGYDIVDSPIFLYWMPVLRVRGRSVEHPFPGGYKVHVSIDPSDAERVARTVLPMLQMEGLSHKVVYPLSTYTAMNGEEQRGKFITVYAGPLVHGLAGLVTGIDPMLKSMQAVPGPLPLDRQSGHSQPETRIGLSGTLSYVVVPDYRR